MSIYYTPDPDDYEGEPRLPPLLTPCEVDADALAHHGDVHAFAVSAAKKSEVGTVFYAAAGGLAQLSVALAPDVTSLKAAQMFHALMIGVGDAIGAIAPPEVEVNYLFPVTFCSTRDGRGMFRLPLTRLQSSVMNRDGWLQVPPSGWMPTSRQRWRPECMMKPR